VADWTRRTFQAELPRGQQFQATMTGLRNIYGNRDVNMPKAALTPEDLTAIYRQLDTRYFEHARDWCACLLAFFGLLRIGEYMGAGLRLGHVTPTRDGLDVTILCSKTSRAPHTLSISARSDHLCPQRAFRHYRDFIHRLGLPAGQDDALFVFRFDKQRHRPMTGEQFIQLVRGYIAAALPDRDPSLYAGHSFRRGGASALILAGVPDAVVQAHGRWSSDTYKRYYDAAHSSAMRLAATRALATTRS
jgi:hypothetical protein